MKINNTSSTQVLIAGAGPSGLMMACQLALRGIAFRIVDKNSRKALYSGALMIHARSMEIFDQMGIAEKFLEQGVVVNKINIRFNERELISLNLKDFGLGLTKYPYVLLHEQSKTEQLLIDFLEKRNIFVEQNAELVSFSQENDRVTCVLQKKDGVNEMLETCWLIAADGGKSFVRQQLKIPFPGMQYKQDLFLLDCDAKSDVKPGELNFYFSAKSSLGIFSLGEKRLRIDGDIPVNIKFTKKPEIPQISRIVNQLGPSKIDLFQVIYFSTFHSRGCVAKSFRQERVFLIGDAAHVFNPVGAQGMNTGIQDAYNLAWKLCMVIKGAANEFILDTYHMERFPIAKSLVYKTNLIFRFITKRNIIVESLKLYFVPFLLKAVLPLLEKKTSLSQYFFKGISEVGVHYRRKSFFNFSVGSFGRSAPKPGDRLPYVIFNENGKEVNIQNRVMTKFCLLVFSGNSSSEFSGFAAKYEEIISVMIIPFSDITRKLYHRFGIRNSGMYLVRPDGYVAFRSDNLEYSLISECLGLVYFKAF